MEEHNLCDSPEDIESVPIYYVWLDGNGAETKRSVFRLPRYDAMAPWRVSRAVTTLSSNIRAEGVSLESYDKALENAKIALAESRS